MSIRILALAWYARDGASSRVRMMQYVPHLEQRGISVEVHSLLPDDYVERLYRDGRRSFAAVLSSFFRRIATVIARRNVDIIWLQREVAPYVPFGLERALLSGRKLVVDYDDAHHLYYKRSSNPVVRDLLHDKLERLMAVADVVTVGSPTMAAVAQAAGARRTEIIHSAVEVGAIPAVVDHPFTVGWIGTPMTADESLPMVAAPLKRFLEQTGAKCLLVGVRPDQFPNLPAECVPWSEAGQAAALARMSVGICPLPDTPWHRGKSGYKIIQYMAAGIPAVVSPVGVAADIARPDETGFHCRTDVDWYTALMTLHGDASLRARQGLRAREIATTTYDTAVVAAKLTTILEALSPRAGSA